MVVVINLLYDECRVFYVSHGWLLVAKSRRNLLDTILTTVVVIVTFFIDGMFAIITFRHVYSALCKLHFDTALPCLSGRSASRNVSYADHIYNGKVKQQSGVRLSLAFLMLKRL